MRMEGVGEYLTLQELLNFCRRIVSIPLSEAYKGVSKNYNAAMTFPLK